MSRVRVSPALACLTLALGCPSNDDWTRYEGPYGGTSGALDDGSDGELGDEAGDDEDDEDDEGEDDGDEGGGGEGGAAEGDGGGDDGEPTGKPLPSPVFPTPTLTCFQGSCIAAGLGGGKELEGRDIVREAFYAVAGFPDLDTYESHVNHEAFAPPQGGAIRRAQDAVRLVTALVVQSGVPACEALPLEGEATLADVPGVTLKFAPGERTIPDDHLGEGETYDKQVVMTDAAGATAVIETTCGRQAGFATMELVEAPGVLGRIELYWDETDSKARKLELISYRKDLDERVAFRFETWEEEAAFWLVRARPGDSPGEIAALRVYATLDTVDQQATALVQAPPHHSEVFRLTGSDESGLAPVPFTTVMCADFLAEDPTQGQGAPCNGLPLMATPPPAFDLSGEFSIEWAAVPAGEGGLLDAFEPL